MEREWRVAPGCDHESEARWRHLQQLRDAGEDTLVGHLLEVVEHQHAERVGIRHRLAQEHRELARGGLGRDRRGCLGQLRDTLPAGAVERDDDRLPEALRAVVGFVDGHPCRSRGGGARIEPGA